MSHWKSFSSEVLTNSKEHLLRTALGEIGVDLDTTIKSIKNPWGQECVDMGFKVAGKVIALGLKETTDTEGKKTLELKGDFYSTGLNESTFMDRLSQVYQRENIIEKFENNGWTVTETNTDEYGNIVIEAYEYAMA